MSRYLSNRGETQAQRVRFDEEAIPDEDGVGGTLKLKPSDNNFTEDKEPFMGFKVRRKASIHRDYLGDYLDVPSRPYLMKILKKQGILSFFHLNFLGFLLLMC